MIVIANTLEEVVQFLNKNFRNSTYSIDGSEVVEVSPNLENPVR
jgi:hypothetical protein